MESIAEVTKPGKQIIEIVNHKELAVWVLAFFFISRVDNLLNLTHIVYWNAKGKCALELHRHTSAVEVIHAVLDGLGGHAYFHKARHTLVGQNINESVGSFHKITG
jgi:hypothetical protein